MDMGRYLIRSFPSRNNDKQRAIFDVYNSIRHKDDSLLFFVGETEGLLDQIEDSVGYNPADSGTDEHTNESDSRYPIIRVDLRINHYTDTASFDNQLRRAVNGSIFDAANKYGNIWGNRHVTVSFVDLIAGIPHQHSNLEIITTLAKYMRDYLCEIDEGQKKKPLLLIDNYDSVLNHVENGNDGRYCMNSIGHLINALSSNPSLIALTVVAGQNSPDPNDNCQS